MVIAFYEAAPDTKCSKPKTETETKARNEIGNWKKKPKKNETGENCKLKAYLQIVSCYICSSSFARLIQWTMGDSKCRRNNMEGGGNAESPRYSAAGESVVP